jgi:hypothetical protein
MDRLLTSERLVPDAVISWQSVLFVVAAAFAVTLLSELPSIRRLWRLDLAGVTRERVNCVRGPRPGGRGSARPF